jgi:NADH-quinone oxidoreductase subunit N
VIDTPHVDWLALSPTLALLVAAGIALLAAVIGPAWTRRAVAAGVTFAGFATAALLAVVVFSETTSPEILLEGSMARDRLAAFAQVVLAVTGAVVVLTSWSERRSVGAGGEYYALLATAGAGMVFFVGA